MKCTRCNLRKGIDIGTFLQYKQQHNPEYKVILCHQCILIVFKQLLDLVDMINYNKVIEDIGKQLIIPIERR